MNKFFIDDINKGAITGEEYTHLSRVLRLKVGDNVLCLDGGEYVYTCVLTAIDKSAAYFKVVSKDVNPCNPAVDVTLFQALPKGDKLELIIQKVSELGVSRLVPFESKYCIAKGNDNKIDRLRKIAISACKQCGRSKPLQIDNVVKFAELSKLLSQYDTVVVAYENEDDLSLNDIKLQGRVAIVVGSEGGFSDDEIMTLSKCGKVVTLGKRILRAETAAITLSSIVLYNMGELR